MRKMTKDVMVYVFKNCFLKKIVTLKNVGGEANVASKAGYAVKTAQSQTLTWNPYPSQSDIVDLLQAVGYHTKVMAYAFFYLQGEI